MDLQTVEVLIRSSRPRRAPLRASTLILLGLSMLLGALWADPTLLGARQPLGWLLPQVVLATLLVVMWRQAMRQRRSGRLMAAAFEAVQLRQWAAAQEALQRLLAAPVTPTSSRAEALLALAAVAESEHAYDASQSIYEHVLSEQTADPLQLHAAHVALAGAMLRTGQVTDAVALIERLERAGLPDVLRAQVELLALFREVTMGQAERGLEQAEPRRELFRQYLGTRAGYGYGLLAAVFERAGQPERAANLWHDATLLVRPAELLARFEELGPVAAKYPAAEYPF